LLFQNGGSLYDTNAGDTLLNSEESIQGITQLTELFTIYNLPVDIPNFYQHFRNGDIPIGIADYSAYNLLLNAAPEIAESWNIGLIPGVENEDGEILRYSAGGAESTVLFKSDDAREAQAWEFMKWWSSAEVQSEYGQTLQISYGDEYMWNTANLTAFNNLPWDSQDKEIIMEQSTWVLEAPRILGTYMLEREFSNAFNDIVVNGKTLRTRIDKAVKVINRETERKLEEFGYIKNGEIVKEYSVPNIDTVNQILGNTN
jgi:ABC-type glycerol-3-phosphate transport system substrate-binding protein